MGGMRPFCLLFPSRSVTHFLPRLVVIFITTTLHPHKSAPEGSLDCESGYSGHLRAYSLRDVAFGIGPARSLAVEMMLTSILPSML